MADRSPNLIDNVTPSGALAYDAPQPAPAAVSPFGPVRKQQPPVKIPGQRQPNDSIAPRPAPPQSRFAPEPEQVATWRQHAEQFFSGDAYDRPASWNAFGNGAA